MSFMAYDVNTRLSLFEKPPSNFNDLKYWTSESCLLLSPKFNTFKKICETFPAFRSFLIEMERCLSGLKTGGIYVDAFLFFDLNVDFFFDKF